MKEMGRCVRKLFGYHSDLSQKASQKAIERAFSVEGATHAKVLKNESVLCVLKT